LAIHQINIGSRDCGFWGGKMKQVIFAGSLIVIIFAFSAAAYAGSIPVLTITDGTTTVIIQDGGIGDINPIAGVITYSGSIGPEGSNWNLNVTTGITKPAAGTASNAQMDLCTLNVSSTGAGTLTILFHDDFFGPYAPAPVTSSVGGNTIGSVTYNTYFHAANDQPSLLLLNPMTQQTFSGEPFSGTAYGTLGPDDLNSDYSLTQELIISHAGPGKTGLDAFFEVVPVPEPGGLLLLFIGVGFFASIARVLAKN
jgi:hypothetical protein